MTMLNIKREIYERLARKAAAKNTTVEKLVEPVLDEFAETGPSEEIESNSARQLAALESFIAGMTAWTGKHLPPGHVVDDSRESIYEGRGE